MYRPLFSGQIIHYFFSGHNAIIRRKQEPCCLRAAAGLTPVESNPVNAPFIKEFPLALECALRHTFELGLHTQFVGEIMDVKADASVIGGGRFPDIEKVKSIIFSPGDRSYYGIGPRIGAAFSIGREILK